MNGRSKRAGRAIMLTALLAMPASLARAQFTWDGTVDFATAVGSNTLASTSTLAITTTNDHNFNGTALVINGTVNWTGGNLRSGNNGSITNNNAWNDASTDPQFNAAYGGAFSFTNATTGTYTKSAAGQTSFFVPFNNDGSLVLTTGTLNLQGGGTFSGTGSATVASGATLLFNSTYSITNGASLLGAGSYQLVSNTLTMSGTVSVNNFVLASGQLAGTQTFAGGVNWTGTDLNTAGTTTNGTGSTLKISTAADHNFNSRALVNNGTVNWTGGNLRSGNNGSITNNAAWNDASTDQQFNAAFGAAFSFTNATTGTYTKSATGQTSFFVPFNNSGALVLTTGRVNLQGGGSFSSTGSANADSGTTVYFNSNFAIADASLLAGSGDYVLVGGSLSLTGVLGASGFKLQSGQLANSQTFNSTVPWTGTDLNTAGTTTIGANGVFTISTAADHNFNTRAIVNNGTVNWTGGNLRSGNGGSITNYAAWNDASTDQQFNAAHGGAASFTNSASGNYAKSAPGTTTFFIPVTNAGTISVTAGALVFSSTFTNSGALTLANGASLQFSGALTMGTAPLSGTGTITAPSVTAGGLVSPGTSPGTLTLTGNLTLLGTSTLLIELGGMTQGTGYDFLNVGGSAVLAGGLSLTFANGFQSSVVPANTFTVLTASGAGGLTGSFANISHGQRLLTLDGAGSFQVNFGTGSTFGANSIVLSNFVAVPEPSTYALLGLGALAIVWTVRRRRERRLR